MRQLSFLTTILFLSFSLKAQSSSELLAEHIAKRMMDSLSMTITQKEKLYQANLKLHNQKMIVRLQLGNDNLLISMIQNVENKRDSIYREILTAGQMILYQQKKAVLVSSK